MLNRGHKGTFQKLSPKHVDPCVMEFAGRHNRGEFDTIGLLKEVARGMWDKRLRYLDLNSVSEKATANSSLPTWLQAR